MEIKNQDFENMSKEELAYILKNIKYGLIWSSNENTKEHFEKESENAYPVLKGIPEKDILTNKDKSTNLLIEGDNYHVLSVMQYTHKNSIDVIYIDPPYNTGNKDFVYNDRFVDKEDGWRHSKWLSFMNKRLRLARELLKEDGVIFISIDDNELAQLKLLCDETFSEQNYISTLSIVNNLKGRSDDNFFATASEFLLVYAKNKTKCKLFGLPLDDNYINEFNKKDNKGRYKEILLRKTGKNSKRNDRPNMFYPIYYNETSHKVDIIRNSVNDIEILPLDSNNNEGRWRWGIDTFVEKKDTEIVIRKNNKNVWCVYTKMRLETENGLRTLKPKTIWLDPKYDTSKGTLLIKEMFGENIFTNPKPIEFIKDILKISSDKESVILDFFAGSGTTGHAVLELNQEDGGNRQFILVTNNENNICTDVTYPRIQKVIEGYTTPKGKEVEGLGGNLRYYKTDFVQKNANIDQMLSNLVHKCTDILCIKENVFDLVSDNRFYQIYQSNKKVMAVFTGTRTAKRLQKLQNELSKFNGEKVLYCFTLNPTGIEVEPELYELFKGVRIEPIPHEIKHMLEEAMNICK